MPGKNLIFSGRSDYYKITIQDSLLNARKINSEDQISF